MKGRKPIPGKILDLKGGRRHTHRAPRADIKVKSEIPPCPDYLGEVARAEWKRFTAELDKIGLIGKIDQTIIAVYCREFETVLAMDEIIKKKGYIWVNKKTGELRHNKAVDLRNKAEDRMVKALQELFGSPSSRARNKVEKPKREENNEFTKFA